MSSPALQAPPVVVDGWRSTLRAVAAHAPHLTFLVSDATHWRSCVGPWADELGLTEADVAGRPLAHFNPHLAADFARLARTALAGRRDAAEFDLPHPGVGMASWRVLVTPLDDGAGGRWVLWSAEDVRPVRDRDAGRAAEIDAGQARFRAALEGAPAGVVLLDAQADGFVVAELNEHMCHLLGMPRETYLGADVAASVAAGAAGPEPLDLLHDALTTGAGDSRRSWVAHADGSAVPVQVSCSAPIRWVDADRRDRVQLVLTFVDRTAAARAERAAADALHAEQQASQRLRDVDRLRSDFVSAVSHELRTPLTAMLGNVEVLLDDDLGPVPDGQREALEVVADQGQRLQRMIEALLRSAYVERYGAEVANRTWSDLRDVVGIVQEQFAATRGHRLRLSVPAGRPLLVPVVRDLLRDAVAELVANAVTVSPAGSTVEVEVVDDGAEVTVTVSDRGPGIGAHDLARVFDRFFRTDHATAQALPGTGLGLWLVAQTVEGSGGRVHAAQRDGGGAVVGFTVPVRDVRVLNGT